MGYAVEQSYLGTNGGTKRQGSARLHQVSQAEQARSSKCLFAAYLYVG